MHNLKKEFVLSSLTLLALFTVAIVTTVTTQAQVKVAPITTPIVAQYITISKQEVGSQNIQINVADQSLGNFNVSLGMDVRPQRGVINSLDFDVALDGKTGADLSGKLKKIALYKGKGTVFVATAEVVQNPKAGVYPIRFTNLKETIQSGTSAMYTIKGMVTSLSGKHTLQLVNKGISGSPVNPNFKSVSLGVISVNGSQVINPPNAQPLVTITGKPTLVLNYDSAQKESSLLATFNLNVRAGSSDLYLYTGFVGANLVDQNGGNASAVVNVGVAAGEKSNTYGNYTVLPSGSSVQMTVNMKANPKQMFAGSYHGFLSNIFTSTANSIEPVKLMLPSNTTNDVTIIGETSPYINSIYTTSLNSLGYLIPGGNVTVTGVRFANVMSSTFATSILIDGENKGIGFSVPYTGLTINFDLPQLTNGYHTFQYINDKGASNVVSFQVQSTSTQPTITVLSPNGGESFVIGSSMQVRWTSQGLLNQPEKALWTGLQFLSGAVCNIGSISSYSTSINLGLVAGYQCPGTSLTLIPGQYKAIVYVENTSNTPEVKDTSDDYFTITSATSTTQSPYISSVAGMAASNNEIDAGGKVGIQGTNLAGYNNSASVFIGGMPCTITQIDNTLIYCTAPTNLVAGNKYDLYINSVSTGGDKVSSNIVQVKVLSVIQTQPSITVISPNGGESFVAGTSLNGSFSSSGLTVGNTYEVALVGKTTNGSPYDTDVGFGLISSTPNGKQPISVTIPSNIPAGTYRIRLVVGCNDSVGLCVQDQSDSNFTISSGTPAPLPPVISGGTFPTQLNVGQQGTWTVNASDPQNGSLSYYVDWGDVANCNYPRVCVTSRIAQAPTQNSTFTHTYTTAGTYKATFRVSNSAGLTAETTSTVNVVSVGIVTPATSTPPTISTTTPIIGTTTIPVVVVPPSPPVATTTVAPVKITETVDATPTYSCVPRTPPMIVRDTFLDPIIPKPETPVCYSSPADTFAPNKLFGPAFVKYSCPTGYSLISSLPKDHKCLKNPVKASSSIGSLTAAVWNSIIGFFTGK